VPLVEAMAGETPVVALDRGAVGETLGDGGIRWTDADPNLFASSLLRIAREPDLAGALAARGKKRYHAVYHPDRIEQAWKSLLGELSIADPIVSRESDAGAGAHKPGEKSGQTKQETLHA